MENIGPDSFAFVEHILIFCFNLNATGNSYIIGEWLHHKHDWKSKQILGWKICKIFVNGQQIY